jgi:hypothetical protein
LSPHSNAAHDIGRAIPQRHVQPNPAESRSIRRL